MKSTSFNRHLQLLLVALFPFPLAAATVLFQDNFNAPDGSALNADLVARTAGSSMALNWNVYFDFPQNTNYKIEDGQLKYTGPGGGTANPDKLFLSNPQNGARINFSTSLAGQRYEIRFSATSLGSDATDMIGFTLSDIATGGANGVLAVRQLFSRSIVDVIENGVRVLRSDRYTAGEKATIRMIVDETGPAIAYEVFRNDFSIHKGTLTVASEDRYIMLQIQDADRDGALLVDDFRLSSGVEPVQRGPGIFAGFSMDPEGWISSGHPLGTVRVNHYPWIYLEGIGNFAYSHAGSGWYYLFKPDAQGAPAANPGPGPFADYEMTGDWVDTGAFLGHIWVGNFPWVYILGLDAYGYVPDGAGWLYLGLPPS